MVRSGGARAPGESESVEGLYWSPVDEVQVDVDKVRALFTS